MLQNCITLIFLWGGVSFSQAVEDPWTAFDGTQSAGIAV